MAVPDGWYLFVPGAVILLGFALVLRWLAHLEDRTEELAERVARLEGRRD